MSCAHCGAVEQRGRFCVRCGKRLPRPLTLSRRRLLQPMRIARPAPVAAREVAAELTQPVLRFDRPARPVVPHEEPVIPAGRPA